ncbi:Glycosyl hydrolases family 2, sugar binding domain [compost metagenome]
MFGAYGWAEGLKLMKWLTDHMLVRGVNYFIPHAFSQKEFPDPDCPPHLYARGQNPQYRYYKILNHYTNRMSHLLSGGRHRATTAVLYHAEAEWSGACMYFHIPVKELTRNQIDCDVLPIDSLLESALVRDGKLAVGPEDYECMIIPFAEALPKQLMLRMLDMADQGLPLLFVDALPKRSSEGADVSETLRGLSDHSRVAVVPLSKLSAYVQKMGWNEIVVEKEEPYLRYYHYEQPDFELFMFFNEHPLNDVHTNVQLPLAADSKVWVYDALHNKISVIQSEGLDENSIISLRLAPYESTVLLSGDGLEQMLELFEPIEMDRLKAVRYKELEIKGPWRISIATSEQYPVFVPWNDADELGNMSCPDKLPRFSGTFRYDTKFNWLDDESSSCRLDLGSVYETVEVWVNGQSVGARICPPYVLDISDYVQSGSNSLVIEVTNTLVKQKRDPFSRFVQQEPSGLLGPIKIIY